MSSHAGTKDEATKPVSSAWSAVFVACAMLGLGCAHEDAEGAKLTELNRTVESLRAQNQQYSRQIEELENRNFILGEQIEARRGGGGATKINPVPALPNVTLHPSQHGSPPSQSAPAEMVEESGDPTVEYAGDAAKTSAKRPLLRLYGEDMAVLPVGERASERERDDRAPRRVAVTSETHFEPRPGRTGAVAAGIDAYRHALEALRAGRTDQAATEFREFLKAHAGHDLADNAQYWLGECSYTQKDYPTAVREFRKVVEKYAQGNKVPDALLKIGFSYLALGSTEFGRQTLEQVVHSYPRTDAALLASDRLAELGRGGASAMKTAERKANREETP